jgi:hypothetical protein
MCALVNIYMLIPAKILSLNYLRMGICYDWAMWACERTCYVTATQISEGSKLKLMQ